MRVSRTRFSKRRLKRKTEFPIVAVVQKKRKPEYQFSPGSILFQGSKRSFGEGNLSERSGVLEKDVPKNKKSIVLEKENISRGGQLQSSQTNSVERDKIKDEALSKSEKRNSVGAFRHRSQKKSRATIDYKNIILLRNLITAEGKILPRRINKLTAKQQRNVQKAIKSARIMGLVPFINKSRPFSKS